MSGTQDSSFVPTKLDEVFSAALGLAAQDRVQFAGSIGRLFRGVRSGTFIEQMKTEYERLRATGEMAIDFPTTVQHQDCLQDMLDSLDDEGNDDTRFQFLKSIFFTICQEKTSQRESVLPQQLMRIGRTLTSTEVLVLIAEYRRFLKLPNQQHDVITSYNDWSKALKEEGIIPIEELIHLVDAELVRKQIFSARYHADASGVRLVRGTRLTALGLLLCNYAIQEDGNLNSTR